MSLSSDRKIYQKNGKLEGRQPFDFVTWNIEFDMVVPNNQALVTPILCIGDDACFIVEETGIVKVIS